MLQLRPSCEHCDVPLPPDSTNARICSYECTFCERCVRDVLHNVCPNCGGGFVPRPVRPANDWKNGNCLANDPASTDKVHKPVDAEVHRALATALMGIAPQDR